MGPFPGIRSALWLSCALGGMPLGMEHHDGQVCISVLSRQGQMMMRGGAKKCSQLQVTYRRNRTTPMVEQVDLLPGLGQWSKAGVSAVSQCAPHSRDKLCGIGELVRLGVI